ncbi:MAG: response regulator [bacterium]|nr:response regulator [bacterium]MCP5070103.1 response regulator [bacterium]
MSKASTRSAKELQSGLLELVHRLHGARGVAHDSQLAEAVGTVAQMAGAERSILRLIDDQVRVLAQYSWAADGRAFDPLKDVDFKTVPDTFSWTTQRYRDGEITMVERPEELPPEAENERAFLIRRGVRSWLAIPLQVPGVAIGYQSFETLTYNKRWSEEEISALRVMAEILASTITRVRAEQAGRESEERFFRVFNDHPDAMVISRLGDGAIVECNSAWTRLAEFGAVSATIGHSIEDLVSGTDGGVVRKFKRALATKGETGEAEFGWTAIDGSERIVLVSSALIDLAGESCALTTVRDVTERHRFQEQLQQAQKMEAVGLLAGGIAHDFNNMLTVIQGHSEILSEALEGPLAESAYSIKDAAERSSNLTRQLLVFSRRDMNMPIVLSPNEMIEGLKPMLRSTLGETIQMSTELDPEVPGVRADPGRLEQALLNLALNAREACLSGSGKIVFATRRVRLRAGDHPSLPPDDYVALEVRDDGHGIEAEILERVTEPFFTTKAQGTGLGLAIVHGVARQSQGDLQLESEPNEGTLARILLPAAHSTAEVQECSSPPDPIAVASEPLCILLVEDEEMVRALARRVLETEGHRVIEASDGLEAMVAAREIPGGLDMLVTDVVMPRMGGLSLARELGKLSPGLPIVVMSGYPDGGSDAEASKLPAGAVFLNKPFQPVGLLTAIEDARARIS